MGRALGASPFLSYLVTGSWSLAGPPLLSSHLCSSESAPTHSESGAVNAWPTLLLSPGEGKSGAQPLPRRGPQPP
jgi:hypothetical protein